MPQKRRTQHTVSLYFVCKTTIASGCLVEKSRTIANSVNNNDFLIIECFVRWKEEAISESSLMEEAVSSFLVTKNNFFGFGNK
jgi:hypothetical protein